MSEDFKTSKPAFVGNFVSPKEFEVKTETVEEKSKKLGWTCCERHGWEVKVVPEDFDQRLATLSEDQDKMELISSLENLTELLQGQKVLVMSITGWCYGTVMLQGRYLSSPHVESHGSVWPLEMADDERKCWVTSSQINKKCFEMIQAGR